MQKAYCSRRERLPYPNYIYPRVTDSLIFYYCSRRERLKHSWTASTLIGHKYFSGEKSRDPDSRRRAPSLFLKKIALQVQYTFSVHFVHTEKVSIPERDVRRRMPGP